MSVVIPGARRGAVFATAALLLGLYLGVGVFDHDIWAPVEPTVVGVVWNMVDSGDLVIPRVNHDPFVEKPPFYYWLAWGTAEVAGGLDPGTLRLPAALLGLGCLAAVFWIAQCAWGSPVACVTTLLAGLTGLLWDASHRAASDVAATFFAFLCFALFARTLVRPAGDPRDTRRWDLAFAAVLALSFYAKNVFAWAVVLPPVAAFLLWRGEVRRLCWITIAFLGLAVVFLTPWLAAVWLEGGWETFRIVIFDNSLGRFLALGDHAAGFTTPMSNALSAEKEPFWFYLPRWFAYPLPWTPLVLVGLVRLVRAGRLRSPLDQFLLVGVVVLPAVLSLSSSKSTDYLVPIIFFDVLIVGRFLSDVLLGVPMTVPERRVVVANVALGLVVIAVLPIALLVAFGDPTALWLVPLAAGAAVWLARRLRHGSFDLRWFFDFSAVASLAAILGLALALPAVDRTMTYQPFFDEVEPHLEGRGLVTTYHEITRLPLFNYYLDRRLDVSAFDEVLRRLDGGASLAALVRCSSVEAARDRLAALDVRIVREEERGRICFLASPASGGEIPFERVPGLG